MRKGRHAGIENPPPDSGPWDVLWPRGAANFPASPLSDDPSPS